MSDIEPKPRRAPIQTNLPVDASLATPQNKLGQPWVSQERQGSHPSISRTAHGYPLDELRSALQKAIRRGQEEEAAWCAWQIQRFGWSAYLWRTLRLIASEDVGIADPMVAVQIDALANNAEIGTQKFKNDMFMGLCEIQAIQVLCRANKSWETTHLLCKMVARVKKIDRGEISPPPLLKEAIDAHTQQGRRNGATKMDWYNEGDALYPRADNHHLNLDEAGNSKDIHADIHGDPDAV